MSDSIEISEAAKNASVMERLPARPASSIRAPVGYFVQIAINQATEAMRKQLAEAQRELRTLKSFMGRCGMAHPMLKDTTTEGMKK